MKVGGFSYVVSDDSIEFSCDIIIPADGLTTTSATISNEGSNQIEGNPSFKPWSGSIEKDGTVTFN